MKNSYKNRFEKIIFLDIDGVLVLYPGSQSHAANNTNKVFSKCAMENLKKIIDKTNAAIVMSSSWRLFREYAGIYRNELAKYGIDTARIVGCTINMAGDCKDIIADPVLLRSHEIKDYVERHELKNYIILDDFDLDDKEHLIKTNMHFGLTDELAELAIESLLTTN